jgi:hypothetical protein
MPKSHRTDRPNLRGTEAILLSPRSRSESARWGRPATYSAWARYTYSGGSWAEGHVVEDTSFIVSVSCPSASFCVAADNVGNIYTYSTT